MPPQRAHLMINCLLGACAVFLVLLIAYAIINKSNLAPATPSWTVTHTFSGTGNADTASFTTNNHWRLRWKCQPRTGLATFVANATNDTKELDYVAFSFCNESTSGGLAEGHIEGTITLEVMTQGPWTADVEEWE